MGVLGLDYKGVIRDGVIIWIYWVKSLKRKGEKRWKADDPVLQFVDLLYLTRDPLVN